jgi:hypothetical protein
MISKERKGLRTSLFFQLLYKSFFLLFSIVKFLSRCVFFFMMTNLFLIIKKREGERENGIFISSINNDLHTKEIDDPI